jgi:hypothetical protein
MINLEDKDLCDAAKLASQHYQADIFLYSGPIDDRGFGDLASQIAQHKTHDRCLLILTTNGGDAGAAYKIARIIQKMYKDFFLYIPSYCKSAGTLVALGANRLIMDLFSELGPLDVQLARIDEIGGTKSGLLIGSAMESLASASFDLFEQHMLALKTKSGGRISFRLASELAAQLTAGLFAPIYAQINPDIIGSDQRDLNIAIEYGDRLADVSKNPKQGTVSRLVTHYPSHDFVIDDEETAQLFRNVDTPSKELYSLLGLLTEFAYDEASDPVICALIKGADDASAIKEPSDDALGKGDKPEKASAKPPVDGSGGPDRSGDQKPGEPANSGPKNGKNGQNRSPNAGNG